MEYIEYNNINISRLALDLSEVIDSDILDEILKLATKAGINLYYTSNDTNDLLCEKLAKLSIDNLWDEILDKNIISLNYAIWDNSLQCKLHNLKEQKGLIIANDIENKNELFRLDEYTEKLFRKLRPWESTISWAVRWALAIDGIDIVMCKIGDIRYLKDLIHIFGTSQPLDNSEWNYLVEVGSNLS